MSPEVEKMQKFRSQHVNNPIPKIVSMPNTYVKLAYVILTILLDIDRNSYFHLDFLFSHIYQRKGARDQLDQNPAEGGSIINTENVEEDIVVDALESEQRDTKDREFVLPGGQIIGLDQAVIQSIERCRKYSNCLGDIFGTN